MTIGDKVVIGAGSVVSRSIPGNSVAVGVPAKVVCSYDEYLSRRREEMQGQPCYDYSYTIGRITEAKRNEMRMAIKKNNGGFVL